jgi:antitoxin CptB
MIEHKRLKQLQFRSQHRGFNEMDQILSAFARARLTVLSPTQLDDYATLLDLPDWDVFAWLVGQSAPPDDMAAIVDVIRTFMAENGIRS